MPEGWCWSTLGEISDYGKCITVSVSVINDDEWVLELEDIEKDTGRLIKQTIKRERSINGSRHAFSRGQILFSKLRTYLNKVLVAPSNGYCTTEIIPISPQNGIIPAYLNLVLRSQYFLDYSAQCGYGVKMPRLGTMDAIKASIPVPPTSEQQRIVKTVERYTEIIERVQSEKECLLRDVSSCKAVILDLAIHGKLVPQDLSEEPAVELLKRINPAFKPSDNLHYGAKIPAGWQLCHIQDIASVELGKTLDRLKNSGEEKPYLCALNVKWDEFDLSTIKTIRITTSEKERYAIQSGDLLVCEGGDVGRSAIWNGTREMYYQNALHRVRFKTQEICKEFFLYVLRNYKNRGIIDDVCKGVTIKHFTGQVFRSLDFPFPPINEQRRIVKMIKAYYTVLDEIAVGLK